MSQMSLVLQKSTKFYTLLIQDYTGKEGDKILPLVAQALQKTLHLGSYNKHQHM